MKTLFAKLAAFVADVSPKVKAALNWGALASLALAFLNSVTPGDLAFLGKFEPLAWALIPIVIAAVAAWAKTDSVREAGKAALAKAAAEAQTALDAAVKPAPAPAAPEPAPAAVEPPATPAA